VPVKREYGGQKRLYSMEQMAMQTEVRKDDANTLVFGKKKAGQDLLEHIKRSVKPL